MHLDRVEDPPGSDGRVTPRRYTWYYGIVDGQRVPRDRHDRLPVSRPNSRRDDGDDDRYDRHDEDGNRRGHRERKGDSWSSRLVRSLSRAPRERERERSESRHERRRDDTFTHGSRHNGSVIAMEDTSRQQAATPPRSSDSTTGHDLLPALNTPVDMGRPRGRSRSKRPAPVRGRSRERASHRRGSRRMRSEPRQRAPHPTSTNLRARCSSTSPKHGNNNNRHQSPNPPKVRSRGHPASSELQPTSSLHPEQQSTSPATHLNYSCTSTLPPPPMLDWDASHPSNLQENTGVLEPLQVDAGSVHHRFIPGRVYSRRLRCDSKPPLLQMQCSHLRTRLRFASSPALCILGARHADQATPGHDEATHPPGRRPHLQLTWPLQQQTSTSTRGCVTRSIRRLHSSTTFHARCPHPCSSHPDARMGSHSEARGGQPTQHGRASALQPGTGTKATPTLEPAKSS